VNDEIKSELRSELEEEFKLKSKSDKFTEDRLNANNNKKLEKSEKSNQLLNSLNLGKRKPKKETNENELTLSMINNEQHEREREKQISTRIDLESRY